MKVKSQFFLKINGYILYIKGIKIKLNKDLYYKSDNSLYLAKSVIKYIEKLFDYKNN